MAAMAQWQAAFRDPRSSLGIGCDGRAALNLGPESPGACDGRPGQSGPGGALRAADALVGLAGASGCSFDADEHCGEFHYGFGNPPLSYINGCHIYSPFRHYDRFQNGSEPVPLRAGIRPARMT